MAAWSKEAGQPARILLVDDDQWVGESLQGLLRREGYDVVVTRNGAAALRKMRKIPFDLILTDLKMGKQDSLEILAEAQKLWPRPVTIVLTGFASLESAMEALRRGAFSYLIKPCDLEELKHTVRQGLEKGRLSEAESLYNVARSLISAPQIDRVLSGILAEASRMNGFSRSLLILYEEEGARVVTTGKSHSSDFVETVTRLMSDPSVVKGYFGKGEPLILTEGNSTELFPRKILKRLETRSLMAVPLLCQRQWVGLLYMDNTATSLSFTQGNIRFIQGLADLASVAIENARLFDDLRQAKEALESTKRQLERRDEEKTRLFSDVSHEIKTPIVAVKGYTSMVLRGKAGEVNPLQREYLEIALKNIDRQLAMIDELSRSVRREPERNQLSLEAVDLREILSEGLQTVQPRAEEKEIEVRFRAYETRTRVMADKNKLVQAIVNLLSNAVKFTPLGGKVEVRLVGSARSASVSISDTGIGIPEGMLKKIFERFYQVRSPTSEDATYFEGLGLGLSIAQDIVRKHGSEIRAESQIGKGSTFTFKLPTIADTDANGVSHGEPVERDRRTDPRRGRRGICSPIP